MDKTININIAGTLFQIDDEAFRILRDYLQAINNRFRNVQGGHETIEDIESRIAEIFQSQKGLAGVITKENIEAMISIIGKPEEFDQNETEPEQKVYPLQKKRMYRNPDDKIIGGVCSGIGTYLDTDPVLFRILFVLFTVFFGVGFFLYIILWIALPEASAQYSAGYTNTSKIGNAFNEIFRAIGRVCYLILRIFLIIIGVLLVVTGFLFILSFVMVFVFKYPGAFSIDSSGVNIFYFPDFLNYIVNPPTVPWIMILTSLAFLLPMIAIIYWGVKMIFWFRAKDGVVSLVGLVLWVTVITALVIILFNEGISFAKTAKSSTELVLPKSPDTLYIMTDQKVADLKYEKEFSLPHEEYSVYINDDKKELYIRPYLNVNRSVNKVNKVEVRKRSTGRTEQEAMKKIEGLQYNYSLNGDTLHIDEYFTSPAGRKWAADNIAINVYMPVGTILKIDKDSRILFHQRFQNENDENLESRWESRNSCWVLTDDGLEEATTKSSRQK